MGYLLNVRNAKVGAPVNLPGWLTLDREGVARLTDRGDGTVLAVLTEVTPVDIGGRGQNAWTLVGIDGDGIQQAWDVKTSNCGCGK